MRLWLAVFALQRAAAFATPRRVSARHRRMPTAAAKTVAAADTPVDGERAVVREVAGMALPLLLVSLSSPLLSLIDVAVVGRHVGVLGLASLGPATSLCHRRCCFRRLWAAAPPYGREFRRGGSGQVSDTSLEMSWT